MSEERIVYVVTSGEYSDYHIDAVFDNEEAANAFAAQGGDRYGEERQVEQYSLNHTGPQPLTYWLVSISEPPGWRSGDQQITTNDFVRDRMGYPCAWYWTQKDNAGAPPSYHAEAVHPDLDTARKIATDLLAQMKYEHQTNGATRLPL